MGTSQRNMLLACGAIGPPLFVAVFLLEGGTRPGYDPRRHPVSSLAIGARGWRQAANFLMVGASLVACSRGARRERLGDANDTDWEARLLGIGGLGLIGAGLFTTDPVFGYPLEAPLLLDQESRSGQLHNLASVLFFVGVPGACLVACRRFARENNPAWAAYSLLTALAMPVAFVLAGAGFAQQRRLVQNAGVLQRLAIATGLAWVTLRAVRLLRASRPGATGGTRKRR
jgi:hypothetical protein